MLHKRERVLGVLTILLAVAALCSGCGPRWQAKVVGPDGGSFVVDRAVLDGLRTFADESPDGESVPLERALLAAGHHVVERLVVTGEDGARREFDWPAVVESDPTWLLDGRIIIGGDEFTTARVEVEPPALLTQVTVDITDLAPTVATALGLPPPSRSAGQSLTETDADHVLLLFLDGLGYVRYTEALADGLIPNLATMGEPAVGLTVYPPCTSVASAALLTGAPPEANGVDRRGIRKTEVETIFDVATAAGRRVVAVEGNALSFNLRSAEATLSGDRDGNGSTDDNVLANALDVLETGMPDLLYVHFHGIDDAGHDVGPGAPEEEAAIREVDAAVGQIVAALPPDTLVIIFADHGMHAVNEGERQGNHGHLIARDMVIPILMTTQ